jgi:hypothetical protein
MSPQDRLKRILRYLAGDDELPDWMHDRGGWAQSGTLVTHQNSGLVKCAVEKFDRCAVYTVQLGLNTGDSDGRPFQAQAEVTWSINGTPIRRVVSVSQGCSISGVTESVDVRMYDATPEFGEDQTPFQYVGLINVAPGPRAATTLPPFLRIFPAMMELQKNTDFTVDVPENSGVIGVRLSYKSVGTTAPTAVFQDTNGTVFDEYDVVTGENSIFVPLASGTTQVRIINQDGTNSVFVNGQWAIDG